MSKEIFIDSIPQTAEFMDFFMIKAISVRVGSNHKQYLDLNLGDNSGEINGKKWDLSDEEAANLSVLKEGDIVKIKATGSEWNGIKQLRITRIRKAQKEDGLVMMDYIKAAPENAEDMYNYIHGRAEAIRDPELKSMALLFLDENKDRLLYYPAAMRNHHAEMAGLLYHIKRMLMMGEKACSVYTMMDPDWVICGVILHDMEKLNELQSNELGVSSGYSFEGKMLGHIVMGVRKIELMAEQCRISPEKKTMLQHMILSHHYEPEFGSPLKPLFPEAELLHYLDMMDAKFFDFEDALKPASPGEFTERVRTLDGRMLYKPTFKE